MLTRLDFRGSSQVSQSYPLASPAQDHSKSDRQLEAVREIIADVRARGDLALLELALRFDQVKLDSFVVSPQEVAQAHTQLAPDILKALRQAAGRIEAFHRAQLISAHTHSLAGIAVAQRTQPIQAAGLYVPGGKASYPSTVLMTAIVARVAGVERIVMCVPPGPDGKIPPVTLAAAAIAEVDEVYALGGAGAIAAMAYGTKSLSPVDVIAGPGNIYVSLAQREVAGQVAVATPYAGPSEVVVIADETTNVKYAAADLLTQSEHGPDGRIVLISASEKVLDEICLELETRVNASARRAEILATLKTGGFAVLVDDLPAALELSDAIAPEHLQLMCTDASKLAAKVKNAGAVFCGQLASVVLGDYIAGPSHVLPTGGAARFASGLQVSDFQKTIHTIAVSEEGFAAVSDAAATIAHQEGLLAHRDAVLTREISTQPAGQDATSQPVLGELVSPRSYIEGLERYHSPQVEVAARLNTNESPFPPPRAFQEAVSRAASEVAWQLYPERDAQSLREKLAGIHKLAASQIFVANGSNEVIQTLLMCYGAAGRKVLVFQPTYMLHYHIARSLGCVVIQGQRRQDFTLALDQVEQLILEQRPSVIFLCSPNNPTGMAEPIEVTARVLELSRMAGALLVVDEAYVEFSPHSALELFSENAPMAITRTYSKTWAMAAARLGYLIAPSWINAELEKVALPYRLNQMTQTIGKLALDFQDDMEQRVRSIVAERERVCETLAQMGVKVWPSEANFVLIKPETADSVWDKLLERSVLVRDCSAWPRLQGCLRVTIGTQQENNLFLKALEEALQL